MLEDSYNTYHNSPLVIESADTHVRLIIPGDKPREIVVSIYAMQQAIAICALLANKDSE